MAGPSLATQRKNKPATSGTTVVVEQDGSFLMQPSEAQSSPSSLNSIPMNSNAPVAVATVYRRHCGTSPFDKNWLNLDCCGLFCAGLTYFLHMYGCWAVCWVLLPPWMTYNDSNGIRHMSMNGNLHCLLFTGIAIMACISHFNAMTTDPGAVPPDAKPLQPELLEDGEQQPDPLINSPGRSSNKRICRRCNSYKPMRAHHCSICRRCIIKMDHHCPWVNNCVGIGNHKFFLLFLFYTFVSCMYSSSLLIVRFIVCMKSNNDDSTSSLLGNHAGGRCLNDPKDLLPLIGLAVECMLFGLFTSCMIIDQWDVVASNLTHIDRLKGEYTNGSMFLDPAAANGRPRLTGVHEVFGTPASSRREGFRLDWLAPFVSVTFPSSLKDEIMGFCTPCSHHHHARTPVTEIV